MFHPPSGLPEQVQHFLGLEDARRLLADLNRILHTTAFNPRVSNPCFCLALLLSFGSLGFILPVSLGFPTGYESSDDYSGEPKERWGGEEVERSSSSPIGMNIGLMLFLMFLPYSVFFFLVYYMKSARKRRLLRHVRKWNSSNTGVKLSFGGGGSTPRGVTVGSEFGGTYDNFYMAMWDPKGLMFKGYLHVFVHTAERQEWCRWATLWIEQHGQGKLKCPRTSGQPYVAPVPRGEAPAVPYQPPAGFALVPAGQVLLDTRPTLDHRHLAQGHQGL